MNNCENKYVLIQLKSETISEGLQTVKCRLVLDLIGEKYFCLFLRDHFILSNDLFLYNCIARCG